MDILTDFSWIGVAVCVALGAVYAVVLYFIGKRHEMSAKTRAMLAVLRFLAVFFISFLLLSPMLKTHVVETEKPVVVLLHDNSLSIVLGKDSTYYRNEYLHSFEQLKKELADDYQVEEFSFGGDVRQGFDGRFDQTSSDISLALDDISEMYKGRNVGAVVLATDGIYNAGHTPQVSGGNIPYPIYTIALGDTSIRKDATLNNLKYNRITYLNSRFPVEVSLKADKLQGQTKRLTVENNGKTLFSKEIHYTSDHFFTSENILLNADKAGVQLYTIRLQPCDGEASVSNNVLSFAVEVLDSRRRVAIVAQSPHPDLGALKRFFESRESYEAETFVADKFNGNPLDYSMFVLHQLPDDNAAHNSLVDKVLKSQIPALFVLGQQTAYERFDRLQMGLTLNTKGSRTDEATASVNGSFGSFSTDDGIRQVEGFPPLNVPFGNIATATSTQTLLYAKIGNIVTNRPLVAFGQKNGIRYGFVVGDGLWRWPLADYQQNGSSDAFGTLMDKTCTYLSQQSTKEKFVVRAAAAFDENEVITLDAELYNDNFEMVNTADVSLSVADENGSSRNYAFARTQNAYTAALGTLPQGRYTYTAKTFFNGKNYHKNGTFAVHKNNIESHNLTADHSLLNTIAQNSGGQMLYPQQLSQLPELLKNRDDIRNVMFSRYKYSELIKQPWLFVAIILLLAIEWTARRYKNDI